MTPKFITSGNFIGFSVRIYGIDAAEVRIRRLTLCLFIYLFILCKYFTVDKMQTEMCGHTSKIEVPVFTDLVAETSCCQ